MADFDDFRLGRGPERQLERPIRSGPPIPLIMAFVLALSAGALWYFLWRPKASAPEAVPAVAQTTVDRSRRAAEPGEAIDLPPLDQSDGVVRALAERLSSHPVAAAWLTTTDLIRNLTVVVTDIADGDTPAKHLRPLRPAGSFAAKTSGGSTWMDPASYHRYDAIAAAVDGLDARSVARFYATVKPRVDDAYHELTGPGGDF